MQANERSSEKPRRTRGRPTLQDVAALEHQLLAVALREFLDHGYGATSMRRIAQVAQISKTTLYAKYPSKEELFKAIMREQVNRLGGETTLKLHVGKGDIAAGLRAYANRMLDISLHGDLLEVNRLITSESHRFPELGLTAAERTAIGIGQVADFIRHSAQADGLPCRDPEAAAQAFIMMIRGWYVNVMLTNRPVPAPEREAWVERTVHALISARHEW